MKKPFKIIILVLFIAALISLYLFTPVRSFLTEQGIRSFVEQFGTLAPIAFGILYFIAVIALLPASAFTVLAGVLFGKLVGVTVVVIAATAAASTAFVIARFFGKGAINKLGGKGKVNQWIKKIDKKVKNNGFQAFFIMRCLFLPYIYLSYAAGLVKSARFLDFTLGTLATNVIFSFFFVYLGDNLFKGPKALILPVILIVIALQVPRLMKMFKKV